jgi:hypothetical protein
MLRASDEKGVVAAMPTSDPANVYALPLAPGVEADPLARPRGASAALVTVGGQIVLAAESRGARIRVREGASLDDVREAARELGDRLVRRFGSARRRDLVVDTIDGERAAGSRWAEAFLEAGYRGVGTGLRYFAAA